ncbi:MAG: hypothetical protein ACLPSF_00820 [Methylocella sp.]
MSLAFEKKRREQFLIALAESLSVAMGDDSPFDTDPMAPFLIELADDLLRDDPEYGTVDDEYLNAISSLYARKFTQQVIIRTADDIGIGHMVDLNIFSDASAVPDELHCEALAAAKNYIEEIERAFEICLTGGRRA